VIRELGYKQDMVSKAAAFLFAQAGKVWRGVAVSDRELANGSTAPR
jgi:hypothetical protein